MKTVACSYLASLLVMVGLDSLWLTATAGPLYKAHLAPLLLPAFKPAPAAAFYLLYPMGLVVFAVSPALAARSLGYALSRGAFFGTVAYATYDLTNQATLRGWPSVVTVADICWGTLLSAAAASAAYLIVARWSRAAPRR